ncbi:hypothetical protein FCV25MIE_28128 [Fagus crenata]
MASSHDNPLPTEIEVESRDRENASTSALTLASDLVGGGEANILRKKHIGRGDWGELGAVWEVSGKNEKVENEGLRMLGSSSSKLAKKANLLIQFKCSYEVIGWIINYGH